MTVGSLRAGEVLRTRTGEAVVQSVSSHAGRHRVFNLEVEAEHCYFVGELGVLAHNACPGATVDITISGQPLPTSRAARRQTMRDSGRPTSQQPTGQRSVHTADGQPAGRQYDYSTPAPGGGTQQMSVQHSMTDNVPGHGPHWEAGSVKADGQTDSLGRPRINNSAKAKTDHR